ncbi:dr1-associated corepressor [Bacillus rossius redtenbacheri]|uniref:dr1-associated corepressor n=1 Tax=Bacillus rossius redtenbacheri TaxID=93214 RepID=UPI002FDE2322
MPSKKKKYNARFPAGRIKKIMQTDEEVGKVAQAVPVIISRTLELFVESLLKRTIEITNAKHARTLTPSHMKQCILSESRFDFLKDLVKAVPDVSPSEGDESKPVAVPSCRLSTESLQLAGCPAEAKGVPSKENSCDSVGSAAGSNSRVDPVSVPGAKNQTDPFSDQKGDFAANSAFVTKVQQDTSIDEDYDT